MDIDKMLTYWRSLRILCDSMINVLESAHAIQQKQAIAAPAQEDYRKSMN
jgi:hypothetical protein